MPKVLLQVWSITCNCISRFFVAV